MYCTCHAKRKCERSVYCACQAAAGQRRPPRCSSSRKLCVLRLPRTREVGGSVYCACQAAAGQRRPPRRSSSTKLYILRLPRKREVRRLCVLRLPGKRQPRASGHRAAAPLEALCTAPARQKAAAGQGRPLRRSSRQSSMYCACHAKGKCGGSVYCACLPRDKWCSEEW